MSRAYENAQNKEYRPHGAAEWRKHRKEVAEAQAIIDRRQRMQEWREQCIIRDLMLAEIQPVFCDMMLVIASIDDESHPVEEAASIEEGIDEQLPYTRLFNSRTAEIIGSVRHVETSAEVAQADAVITARQIALDENGNLRPFSSYSNTGNRGGSADYHEVHSYTWDGE